MKKGNIIFLAGISSSGKTSLSKTLQNRLSEPYYWLSKDTFLVDMAPQKFRKLDNYNIYDDSCRLFYNTIKLFSDMGMNVIVDSVMLSIPKDCIDLLINSPVMFVNVKCGYIDELRRREKDRGDRNIGQAEAQLAKLSCNIVYDISLDTFERSMEECADIIIRQIDNIDLCTAFQKMKKQIKQSEPTP